MNKNKICLEETANSLENLQLNNLNKIKNSSTNITQLNGQQKAFDMVSNVKNNTEEIDLEKTAKLIVNSIVDRISKSKINDVLNDQLNEESDQFDKASSLENRMFKIHSEETEKLLEDPYRNKFSIIHGNDEDFNKSFKHPETKMNKESIGLEDTEKFLDDPTLTKFSTDEKKVTFNGLSKEEIMKYGKDPFWIKIRWFLFILFWVIWIGMLAFAILIVIYSPKCPYRPKLKWWQNEPIYQLDVENFLDANKDSVGDLSGLAQKLDYFEQLGIRTLCLRENILNEKADGIKDTFGDINDFKKKIDSKDMRLILDIPLSALNDDLLVHWLEKVNIDGVRVVGGEVSEEQLNKWLKIADDVHSKTFKYKLIAAQSPKSLDKDLTKEEYLKLKADFSSLKTDDLKKMTDFISKLKESGQSNSYSVNNYNLTRISESIDSKLIAIYHSLVMLLKGSPLILYGDEIGLKKSKMKWDDSIGCGFGNITINITVDNCDKSVKQQSAYGSGQTLLKVYKTLLKLREEPSFKWGDLDIFDEPSKNIVSYVREAKGFNGYLVAANLNDKNPELVDFKARHKLENVESATVQYFYTQEKNHNELTHGSTIDLTQVILHPNEFIVFNFTRTML